MTSSAEVRCTAGEPAGAAPVRQRVESEELLPPVAAQILRCPQTQGRLRTCTRDELASLNARIATGHLQHADGTVVVRELRAAFIELSGRYAYRVDDGVINLLADCALIVGQAAPSAAKLPAEIRRAQQFYDEWGWQRTAAETFADAAQWEDLRAVSADYRRRCHERVKRLLPASGRILVDAGCGPIQYPEYLEYSAAYTYRVCVDVSCRALVEARRKLGSRGIYVLGDVTNLPLHDGCADAVTCLHVLYHVAPPQQAAGLRELARVLRTGGRGVVVYSWGAHSALMKVLLVGLTPPHTVRRWWEWRRAQLSRLLRGAPAAAAQAPTLSLCFHPQPWAWWQQQAVNCRLEVRAWRSVSVPFLRKCIRPRLGGAALLRLVYALEERWPHVFGRIGAYPLFVLHK